MSVVCELIAEIVKSGMHCHGKVINLAHLVIQSNLLEGDVVEFGCNTGLTAALITCLTQKRVWVYDSFEGLPDLTSEDLPTLPHFKRGAMAVSERVLTAEFNRHGIRLPSVQKGWFSKLSKERLPNSISFAHLDGDLYHSTLDALKLVYPRLVNGGICLLDDYGYHGTPGVRRAAEHFLRNKPGTVIKLETGTENSHGVIFHRGQPRDWSQRSPIP